MEDGLALGCTAHFEWPRRRRFDRNLRCAISQADVKCQLRSAFAFLLQETVFEIRCTCNRRGTTVTLGYKLEQPLTSAQAALRNFQFKCNRIMSNQKPGLLSLKAARLEDGFGYRAAGPWVKFIHRKLGSCMTPLWLLRHGRVMPYDQIPEQSLATSR